MASENYVICMKWGTQYGPEYVNILHDCVQKHLSIPYKFICYTDDPSGIKDGIETRALPEIELGSAPIWAGWRKISSLSTKLGIPEGATALFMDVDLIITGPLDDFFTYKPGKFCIIENWTGMGRGVGNSSVYRFQIGAHVDVFDDFEARHEEIYKTMPNSQTYMSKTVAKNHQIEWWPDEWCRSFKRHCVPKGLMRFLRKPQLPENCRILVFHGPPKPMDAAVGKWEKDGGKRGKFVRPSPWIMDYWKEDKKESA